MASTSEISMKSEKISYIGGIMSMSDFLCWMETDGLRWCDVDAVKNLIFAVNTVGLGKGLKFEIVASNEMKLKIQKIHALSQKLIIRFIESKNDAFSVFVGFAFDERTFQSMSENDEFIDIYATLEQGFKVKDSHLFVKELDQVLISPELSEKFDQIRKAGGELNLIYSNPSHYPAWFFAAPEKVDEDPSDELRRLMKEMREMQIKDVDPTDQAAVDHMISTGQSDPREMKAFLKDLEEDLDEKKYPHVEKFLRRHLITSDKAIFSNSTLDSMYRDLSAYTVKESADWTTFYDARMFLSYGAGGFPIYAGVFDLGASGFANGIDSEMDDIDVDGLLIALKFDGISLNLKENDD